MKVHILIKFSCTPQNDVVNFTQNVNRTIFHQDAENSNPFAPDANNINQFHIPKSINSTFTDTAFLDEIFDYVPVESTKGQIEYGGGLSFGRGLTPNLSSTLKTWLAQRFKDKSLFDAQYKYFTQSIINVKFVLTSTTFGQLGVDFSNQNGLSELLTDKFEQLTAAQNDFFKKGLDLTSLDISIALIFGNKTTIGQVCSFANGLREGTVDDVPGFCCLDAPYESTEWGEKVRK